MNLVALPSDVLIYQLSFLTIKDLNNLSQTNTKLKEIVNNEYLWECKCKLEHTALINEKRTDETWKSFYLALLKTRVISVFCNRKYYDVTIIVSRLSLKEMVNKVINQFNLKPVSIPLLFYTDKYNMIGEGGFDHDGKYFERIIEGPNWDLVTNKIMIGMLAISVVDQ